MWATHGPCMVIYGPYMANMACGCSEGVIFLRRQTNDIVKKKHARHRSCSNFHPPLKNVIFTVGVKSISKIAFLRSMGSTKKNVSYGAWEAYFRVLQHLRSETTTFFSPFIPQRGAKKWKTAFLRSMGSKKRKLHTEHGKHILIFATPLECFEDLFDHEVGPILPQSSWEGVYIYKE